eukprot:CAMPEP_0185781572 /NCGR_PEP_ID=MMETSP1174-20130828/102951_1 /TAXON_ID=35687 /ORGANISM="Dictyocha speculum, Strain CCMP1381" /LENGTH=71 /DNA_ID=CAMNT_0028471619 /DNA_START=138 /DNA_END=350 /DNA_ORIENTATION=-
MEVCCGTGRLSQKMKGFVFAETSSCNESFKQVDSKNKVHFHIHVGFGKVGSLKRDDIMVVQTRQDPDFIQK